MPDSLRIAVRNYLFWGLVAFLLVAGMAIGLRVLPRIVWVGVFGIALATSWVYFAVRWPLYAFLLVLLVLVGFFHRLAIPLGAGTQAGGGTLALGDFLWLGTLTAFLLRGFPRGLPWPARGRFMPRYWMLAPYMVLAFSLPLLGVILFRHPPSFLLSGLRMLQWSSLAPMAAFLCVRYGTRRVAHSSLMVMLLAGALHAFYGLAQFAFGMGWATGIWILPDQLYAIQQGTFHFFYPRATGFLVNPNAYGVYAAILLAIVLAFRPQGFRLYSHRILMAAIAVAGLGIVLSGSRTAILSVLMLTGFLLVLASVSKRVAAGGVIGILLLALVVLLAIPLLQDFLPGVMVERFGKLLEIFQKGADVDPTANARVLEWGRLWEIYVNDYPQGTWVPPSYALGSPIDNYYVLTAIQGSPFFAFAWLLFMAGLAAQGLSVFTDSRNGDLRGVGLLLYLTVGVILGAGLGMSPMPQTQVIGPLWVLAGLCYMLHLRPGDPGHQVRSE